MEPTTEKRLVVGIVFLALAPFLGARPQDISKLSAQNRAGEPKQTVPNKPQDPSRDQCLPCFVVQQPQSKSKEEQAKADSLDLLTRRYMWVTIIGVVGGLIGVGILIWQTILARLAANAAQKAADASKISADALIHSERAWLLLGDFTEEQQNYRPEGINLYLTFKNYGKTPAWVTEHSFHFVRIPKRANRLDPLEPYDPQIIPFGEPVPPDKPYPRICAQLELAEEIVGRPDMPSDFIFYGYIKYRDVFYPTTRQERVTYVRKRFERTQGDQIQDRPGRWVDDGPPEANWCQ